MQTLDEMRDRCLLTDEQLKLSLDEQEAHEVLAAIGLGRTTDSTRYGLSFAGAPIIPLRTAYATLIANQRGEARLVQAGVPELAADEDAVQLPLLMRDGVLEPRARDRGADHEDEKHGGDDAHRLVESIRDRGLLRAHEHADADRNQHDREHLEDIAELQRNRILRANEVKCMFTTPKLLEALCEKINLAKYGIKGVFCGGTEMTPQFHRFAVEELLGPDVYFAPTYGNTLMGLATHRAPTPADNWAIIYYPPAPRAVLEVVDFDKTTELVPYGSTGRVRLTTLTKETFIPRFLERDE